MNAVSCAEDRSYRLSPKGTRLLRPPPDLGRGRTSPRSVEHRRRPRPSHLLLPQRFSTVSTGGSVSSSLRGSSRRTLPEPSAQPCGAGRPRRCHSFALPVAPSFRSLTNLPGQSTCATSYRRCEARPADLSRSPRRVPHWGPQPSLRRSEPSSTCWCSPSPGRVHSAPAWERHGWTTHPGRSSTRRPRPPGATWRHCSSKRRLRSSPRRRTPSWRPRSSASWCSTPWNGPDSRRQRAPGTVSASTPLSWPAVPSASSTG